MKPIPTEQSLQAEKPEEPKHYFGSSYKGRKCPIHKKEPLRQETHECCGCCCSGCEPEYYCRLCEMKYEKAYQKWFNKWGHIVAVGDRLIVENKRIVQYSYSNFSFMRFLHGGKPLKVGDWCKMSDKGYIVKCRKPGTPNMIVIG